MERVFRGKKLNIKVENPSHVSKGIVKLTLNGAELDSPVIPVEKLLPENEVVAVMGSGDEVMKPKFERL